MSVPAPVAPGWYSVARRTERWWDGSHWTEDANHHGRRTTATAVRRSATRMMWIWVAVGSAAWVIFLVLSFAFGVSTALALAVLPVAGSAAIVASSIVGSRLIAALPPTP
jgi:hypothetical protein